MRRRAAALVIAAAVGGAVAACGSREARDGSASAAPAPATPRPARAATGPRLCGAARGVVTGKVRDPQASELSGLVLSRTRSGVLWSHNDSGDAARLFALRADGTVLGVPAVAGAAATDWEDLATGPGPGGGALLYAGDIGDNRASRAAIDVYRVPEPAPAAAATAPAARLRLRYPDGPHDAEALLVDPLRGTLVVVTKELGDGRAYTTAAGAPAGTTATLRRGPAIPLVLVTAGDVSADGRVVALRTYGQLALWARRGREPLTTTLRRAPTCTMRAPLLEGQGEAVALSRHGSVAYTVAEGTPAVLRRYAR